MTDTPLNVLVACEESQVVTSAFRRLGHRAFSCDVQPCSGGHPEWHIQGDVLPLLKRDCVFTTMDGSVHTGGWDLMIAHPPCTYLSNAGACRLYPKKGQIDPERYAKGLEAKAFFMTLLNADIPHIAVENPLPSSVFHLPKVSQWIQPYEHQYFDDPQCQHPYTKRTGLWLKNLPPLVASSPEAVPVGPYVPSGTSRKDRSKYGSAKRGEDAKNRAKTFKGVGRSMAEQWGCLG